jgi:hypothetical protein
MASLDEVKENGQTRRTKTSLKTALVYPSRTHFHAELNLVQLARRVSRIQFFDNIVRHQQPATR